MYKFTFLSFLYHVSVAKGLPPVELQDIFCIVPAATFVPSTYPWIIGGPGGSVD